MASTFSLKVTMKPKKFQGSVTVPSLSVSGEQLKLSIIAAASIDATPSQLKVILKTGKKLQDALSLDQQKLQQNTTLMVLGNGVTLKRSQDGDAFQGNAAMATEAPQASARVGEDARRHGEALREQERIARRNQEIIDSLPQAAERIAMGEMGGGGGAEITDQNGRRFPLSDANYKALVKGQLLHDKGKAFLREGNVEYAISALDMADAEFSKVTPDVLSHIDNYGLLCLDLAWAYFKLGKIQKLRDARDKLRKASESLERAYGKNFTRLISVKGSDADAKTLYVRLHLLRAIVAYHMGLPVDSVSYLKHVEDLLRQMIVSDEEIAPLVEQGFSPPEARLALRNCNKNVQEASVFLVNRRAERKRRRRQERIGRTANGEWVDLDLFDALRSMGFRRKLCAEALRQTNNNELESITILTESPDMLKTSLDRVFPATPSEQSISTCVDMGFPRELALGTLIHTNGDVNAAVNLLISGQGVLPPAGAFAAAESAPAPMEVDDAEVERNLIAEEEAMMEADEEEEEEDSEEIRRREALYAAENDLYDAHQRDPDLIFDLVLDEEQEVFERYRSLLANSGKWT